VPAAHRSATQASIQARITLRVATDVLPLLVNACSTACIEALPTPPEGHMQTPHRGGPTAEQPSADYTL
jgi:hypothetical protein